MLGSLGEPREGRGPEALQLLSSSQASPPALRSVSQVHGLGHCTSPGPPGRPQVTLPPRPGPARAGAAAVSRLQGALGGARWPAAPADSTPNPPPHLNISLAAAVRAIYHANVGAPRAGEGPAPARGSGAPLVAQTEAFVIFFFGHWSHLPMPPLPLQALHHHAGTGSAAAPKLPRAPFYFRPSVNLFLTSPPPS